MISLLFLTPLAAAAPRPPETVVFRVDDYETHSSNVQVNATLVWRISRDDADQINGSSQYAFYRNVTPSSSTYACSYATGLSISCGWSRSNQTGTPVPGRPGWLSVPVQIGVSVGSSGSLCNPSGDGEGSWECAINMTAARLGEEGGPSCTLIVTFNAKGSHGQCGDNITEAPAGVAAQVVSTSNATAGGLILVKWPLSPDDNSTTVGNLTYRVRAYGTNANGETFQAVNDTDPTESQDANGMRTYNVTTGGVGRYSLSFHVAAWDPATLVRSNYSCSVTVNVELTGQTNACNGVNPFGAIGSVSGGAIFPLVNVGGVSQALGLSSTLGPWVFAAIFIALGAAGGLYFGGPVGATMGAGVTFAGAALFGLVPLWLVIILFASGLFTIALLRGGSGREA